MEAIFLLCAVVGGTLMVLQFVLTLLGMDEGGGDVDVEMDVDADVLDLGGDDLGGDDMSGDGADSETAHVFGVLSFRTVVAAIAFFGMAGQAARSGGLAPTTTLLVALAAGGAALLGVYWMMRGLYELRHDGTVRIEGSIGGGGRVYLTIPAGKSGAGKVQLSVQGRTVEYLAMTGEDEPLPTGAAVEVIRVLGPETVEVELAERSARVHDLV